MVVAFTLHVRQSQITPLLQLYIHFLILCRLATRPIELLAHGTEVVLVCKLYLLHVEFDCGVGSVFGLKFLRFALHEVAHLYEGGAIEGILLNHFGYQLC